MDFWLVDLPLINITADKFDLLLDGFIFGRSVFGSLDLDFIEAKDGNW